MAAAEGTACDFAGFVDALWPVGEELSLPSCFRDFEADDAADAFLRGEFDWFGAQVAPSDEDFAALLLGEPAAAPVVAPAAPAFRAVPALPRRRAPPPPPPPPPSRRAASQPTTPDKKREAATSAKPERRYWTEEERAKFHAAMRQHGTDFAAISKFVGTRTSTQVRTHVQKYHLKLVREYQASKRKAAEAKAARADSSSGSASTECVTPEQSPAKCAKLAA